MKYRALLKKKLYSLQIISGEINIGDNILFEEKNLGKVISKVNQYILCMMKIDFVDNKSKNREIIEINKSLFLKFL